MLLEHGESPRCVYVVFVSSIYLRESCSHIQAFLPLVEKAVSGERNVLQASIINVSSAVSSNTIASTLPFFAYDYQCSKAALNMYTVSLATQIAKSNIFIALINPGWVQTDMGGKSAPLNIEEACKSIVSCITSLKNEHYAKLIDATTGSKCEILPF
jgi:NAD(P)-dependent dehydrogenase (short-subunit alcohol dehydrogenase family)